MSASTSLRTLALAAALLGTAAVSGARAEGTSPFDGASAFGAYRATEAAAPVRQSAPSLRDSELNFLERSGATGGNGQHG
jgi:hypothetical protein